MGEVYLAKDLRLNRQVALKFLSAADENAGRRFLREARLAASLEHPHICAIHEISETEDGTGFIVMQYVEGETLAERIKRGSLLLKPADALYIAIQVADALAEAHAHGIVHRDIKPANIIVSHNNQVKVLDFGLAKRTAFEPLIANGSGSSFTTLLSQPGTILGTVSYMSPEQVRGQKADHRTDLWSLGVVLHEMLTGETPFAGETAVEKLAAILYQPPPKPAGMPKELTEILDRALQKEPDKRFQTAAEMIERLQYVKQEIDFGQQLLVHVSTGSSSDKKLDDTISRYLSRHQFDETGAAFPKRRRINRKRFVFNALVILILAAVAGWYGWRNSRIAWAKENIERVNELARSEKHFAAYDLAVQIENILPADGGGGGGDARLAELMPVISDRLSVESEPAGAQVFLKRFVRDENGKFPERQLVGTTPLKDLRIARGQYVLQIEKKGYAPFERTISGMIPSIGGSFINSPPIEVKAALLESGKAFARMVFVPASGEYSLVNWSRPTQNTARLDGFFIDKYEVSNREFKEFIAAGGYLKREFWKYPFIKNGREISFEEAARDFKDRTGLPAPRSWSNQNFPDGKADFPVTDITWYEAAAYAAFRGKSLPTVFQWEKAARNGVSDPRYNAMPWGLIRQGETTDDRANFGAGSTVGVESFEFGMSPYGAFNMAGNVSEWCLNRSGENYVTSGGAWNDLPYSFGDYGEYPGFFSSNQIGFRCVSNLPEATGDQGAEDLPPPEIPSYKPSTEAELKTWLTHYAYDKSPLNAQIIETTETDAWTREKIAFAGEGGEQVFAYLYLPKNYSRPLQVIHYVPPGDVVAGLRSLSDSVEMFLAPVIKSGRAVFAVVLKGYNERPFPANYVPPERTTIEFRKQAVNWMTDLRRGLDYLETRRDLNFKKLSFLGISNGANLGLLALGIEKRYQTAVLAGVGVDKAWQKWIPEANFINFAPHSRLPKLIINGRYDETHPLATFLEPLYKLMSEPKKLVVYDGGHIPTIEFFATTTNSWLDEKLGMPGR